MSRFRVVFTLLVAIGLFGSASALAAPPGDVSPSPPGQVDRGVVDDITREVQGDLDFFCWKEGYNQWLFYKITEHCPPKQPLELVLPADEPVDLCVSPWTGRIRYTPGQNCYKTEFTHTVPDDGPLGICVNAFSSPWFTPLVRWVPQGEAACEADPFKWWVFYEEIG